MQIAYATCIACCKAAGLMGLALAWYAAEPLCCAPYTYTHLNGAAQWGNLGAT